MSNIVVAEDDAALLELVVHHLEREGYGCNAVRDGAAALRAARRPAEMLLLDVGLPGIDGFEVARTLRREGNAVPILMLTARCDEVDRIVGFELGADDYVCKPFSPRELVARMRAVLRRAGGQELPHHDGRLEIDDRAREARVDGHRVALKPQEFALLRALARNAGVALSRQQLLNLAWSFDFDGDERTVDAHVRRLRRRIEEPFGLALIETLRGYGYKLRRA